MTRWLRRALGCPRWQDLTTAERLLCAALYRTNVLTRLT